MHTFGYCMTILKIVFCFLEFQYLSWKFYPKMVSKWLWYVINLFDQSKGRSSSSDKGSFKHWTRNKWAWKRNQEKIHHHCHGCIKSCLKQLKVSRSWKLFFFHLPTNLRHFSEVSGTFIDEILVTVRWGGLIRINKIN